MTFDMTAVDGPCDCGLDDAARAANAEREGLDVERLAAVLNEWQSDPSEPIVGTRWDLSNDWDHEQVGRLLALLRAALANPASAEQGGAES
jgi:hypothetical protein